MLSKIERMNQQFGSLNKNGANAPKLTDEMMNMMLAENNGIGVDKLASLLGGMGKVEPAAMKTLIDETQKKLKVFDNEDDDCEGDSSDNDDDEDFDEDEEEEIQDQESSSRSHSEEFKELEPVPNGVDEIKTIEDKTPQKKDKKSDDSEEKADKTKKQDEVADTAAENK